MAAMSQLMKLRVCIDICGNFVAARAESPPSNPAQKSSKSRVATQPFSDACEHYSEFHSLMNKGCLENGTKTFEFFFVANIVQ